MKKESKDMFRLLWLMKYIDEIDEMNIHKRAFEIEGEDDGYSIISFLYAAREAIDEAMKDTPFEIEHYSISRSSHEDLSENDLWEISKAFAESEEEDHSR